MAEAGAIARRATARVAGALAMLLVSVGCVAGTASPFMDAMSTFSASQTGNVYMESGSNLAGGDVFWSPLVLETEATFWLDAGHSGRWKLEQPPCPNGEYLQFEMWDNGLRGDGPGFWEPSPYATSVMLVGRGAEPQARFSIATSTIQQPTRNDTFSTGLGAGYRHLGVAVVDQTVDWYVEVRNVEVSRFRQSSNLNGTFKVTCKNHVPCPGSCSGSNGVCDLQGVCECTSGFAGTDCSIPVDSWTAPGSISSSVTDLKPGYWQFFAVEVPATALQNGVYPNVIVDLQLYDGDLMLGKQFIKEPLSLDKIPIDLQKLATAEYDSLESWQRAVYPVPAAGRYIYGVYNRGNRSLRAGNAKVVAYTSYGANNCTLSCSPYVDEPTGQCVAEVCDCDADYVGHSCERRLVSIEDLSVPVLRTDTISRRGAPLLINIRDPNIRGYSFTFSVSGSGRLYVASRSDYIPAMGENVSANDYNMLTSYTQGETVQKGDCFKHFNASTDVYIILAYPVFYAWNSPELTVTWTVTALSPSENENTGGMGTQPWNPSPATIVGVALFALFLSGFLFFLIRQLLALRRKRMNLANAEQVYSDPDMNDPSNLPRSKNNIWSEINPVALLRTITYKRSRSVRRVVSGKSATDDTSGKLSREGSNNSSTNGNGASNNDNNSNNAGGLPPNMEFPSPRKPNALPREEASTSNGSRNATIAAAAASAAAAAAAAIVVPCRHDSIKAGSDGKGSSGADYVDSCPVCLVDYVAGEKLSMVPGCSHVFHETCIVSWLAAHQTCPVCRSTVLVVDVSRSDRDLPRQNQVPKNSATDTSIDFVIIHQ